jgi:hypothetical protein
MSEKTYTQTEVDSIHKSWSNALANAKVKLRKYFYDSTIPKAIAARDKEWVAGTQPIIDSFIEFIERGDYSNGNEAQGCDEGEHLAAHHLRYLIEKWQQLKKELEENNG